MQLVTGLAIALLLSLAGNLWQLMAGAHADGTAEGMAIATVELAATVGKVEALAETAARAAQVADDATADQAELLASLATIAKSAQERQVIYRDRIREVPVAACAPGAERMDAWNGALQP